jgi:hypothetical protein
LSQWGAEAHDDGERRYGGGGVAYRPSPVQSIGATSTDEHDGIVYATLIALPTKY